LLKVDTRLLGMGPRIAGAAIYATGIVWLVSAPLADALAGVTVLRAELYLGVIGLVALVSYGAMLLGLGWKR
jgi:hypothetical protein